MILEPQIGRIGVKTSQYDSRSGQSRPVPPVDDAGWYALRPEIRSGALRFGELRLLVEQQQLRADDLIWHPVWETWRPAHEVPGLFPLTNGDPVLVTASRVEAGTRNSNKTSPTKKDLKARAKHELRSYLVITAYTWATLSLLRLHESLIASTYNLDLKAHGWTIVTALILGKVVLIAEALSLGDRGSARAPALTILIKSLLFAFSILLFHLAEHVATVLWTGQEITQHLPQVNGANIEKSLTMAAIITLALMPYFLVKEIEKRTGQTDLLLMAIGLKR